MHKAHISVSRTKLRQRGVSQNRAAAGAAGGAQVRVEGAAGGTEAVEEQDVADAVLRGGGEHKWHYPALPGAARR